MIDRSYLPFQAARDHYDRGMEKWMGFFLSEHTSSLKADKTKELLHTNLTKDQKDLLLSQLYTSHLTGVFRTAKDKGHSQQLRGKITEITPTRNHHQNEIPPPPHQNQGHPSHRRRSRGSVRRDKETTMTTKEEVKRIIDKYDENFSELSNNGTAKAFKTVMK